MHQSLWSQSTSLPQFPSLNHDQKTPILIIGGGLTGLLCAYFLQQKDIPYILAESKTIASGVTKNTTAKITAQHGLLYHHLLKSIGTEQAKMVLEANQTALATYASLCQQIDCDFEEKSAYVYSLKNEAIIHKEITALEKLGIKCSFHSQLPLPFQVAGAIEFPRQAQFNPLKFIAFIAKDLNIFEQTHIISVDGQHALTQHGHTITADKIIFATHFPFANTHGSYFLKMYQHRSYVIALENAPNVNGMYVDEAQKGLSFRNNQNLLLIGGGDHRTGKKGGNWQELRQFVREHYPQSKEKYAWATQDCMTLDQLPYIGHYSKQTPHWYVATGYNKWGMTTAMAAAQLLTKMIVDEKIDWDNVFSPSRSMLKPQLLANGFEATISLLTPTTKRCPHMGCALKWNKAEHTWDCPCHGSRFDENGNLIDNPATHSLTPKNIP